MFEVKTLKQFNDLENGAKTRKVGEVFAVTEERMKLLFSKGFVVPVEIKYRGSEKKTGKDIYIFAKKLYCVGGIETSLYNLVKAFPTRKITIVVENGIDFGQATRLAKYCTVKKDTGEHYKCDVAIMEQYDTAEAIIDRIEARKIYHQNHADWNGLRQISGYQNMTFRVNSRVDKILAVSETCQKGLKDVFNYDSEIVPNILAPADEKPLTFLCLSRGGTEKGVDHLLEFANACRATGKEFVILLASTINKEHDKTATKLDSVPEIVRIEPSIFSKVALYAADYLIQLSENESFGYSPREALQLGIPCICSKIPEFEKLIKNGKNGYLIDPKVGISKAEITKIFTKIPKPTPYSEPVPEIWQQVLDGEL